MFPQRYQPLGDTFACAYGIQPSSYRISVWAAAILSGQPAVITFLFIECIRMGLFVELTAVDASCSSNLSSSACNASMPFVRAANSISISSIVAVLIDFANFISSCSTSFSFSATFCMYLRIRASRLFNSSFCKEQQIITMKMAIILLYIPIQWHPMMIESCRNKYSAFHKSS